MVLWLIESEPAHNGRGHRRVPAVSGSRYIVILNKNDLPAAVSAERVQELFDGSTPILKHSAKNSSDVERLKTFP